MGRAVVQGDTVLLRSNLRFRRLGFVRRAKFHVSRRKPVVSEERAQKTEHTGTEKHDPGSGGADGRPTVPEKAAQTAGDIFDAVKPRLRGWLHLGTAPLARSE